ncbi:hypothetical protein ATANTOWER_022942 [Ataeniobius toweri]|uniref:Uncharacterized protein n=1 Tax=Ataeniobius toweri TaxID=208326 RepID=A0ABU7BKX1_9TELE|nr:hypothetical protein [Ataeniobius toweri]
MMRAFIFLCFFGWAVAAEKIRTSFDCQGCYLPVEGFHTKSPSSREPEKKEDNHVHKHSAAALGTRHRRRASPPTSNWNPLQSDLGFKTEENENQLNATAVVPEDGSNTTTNSSTVTEDPNIWHPLKNRRGFKPMGNENQTNEGNAQSENSKLIPEKPTITWHPLKNRPGFPPEGTKDPKQ